MVDRKTDLNIGTSVSDPNSKGRVLGLFSKLLESFRVSVVVRGETASIHQFQFSFGVRLGDTEFGSGGDGAEEVD